MLNNNEKIQAIREIHDLYLEQSSINGELHAHLDDFKTIESNLKTLTRDFLADLTILKLDHMIGVKEHLAQLKLIALHFPILVKQYAATTQEIDEIEKQILSKFDNTAETGSTDNREDITSKDYTYPIV